MKRPRAEERAALHGPWPTPIEIIAAEFADWDISRDLGTDGTHGDWQARHIPTGAEAKAPTPRALLVCLREHRRVNDPDRPVIDRLNDRYPDWKVWRSVDEHGQPAAWLASNKTAGPEFAPTLHADTADKLEAQLKDPGHAHGLAHADAVTRRRGERL
ncbi:hypothetical protein HNR23_004258 [Nocardiopsis mwathae]|uniref:Uncharacterized protein n=1 Tax=Nocardiopsis mwathae TaxID=1472723 RepID=A0A7X0D791_9ACTN|nr:hypothetical protein [Nocardiopsis mwathae]MBB6174198.1 hypothetical protein [Nocardiopsis mwathae]